MVYLTEEEAMPWSDIFDAVKLATGSMDELYLADPAEPAEGSISDETLMFLKDTETLRGLMMKFALPAGMDEAAFNLVKAWAAGVQTAAQAKKVELLQKHVARTHEALTAQVASVMAIAYGGKEPGKPWSAGMKDNITLNQLVAQADKKGLMNADTVAIEDGLSKLTMCSEDWTKWNGLAGLVSDPDKMKAIEGLRQRAMLTIVEKGLLELFSKKDQDDGDKAGEVGRLIKQLRGEKLTERQAMFASLYKWCYKVCSA